MIPQKIHYCWFGGRPLPKMAQRCIASWRKYLPEYEIIEWNERNFDIFSIPYVKEAYEQKKYAFVSDYARFYILYHEGGLYFDTDVEMVRRLSDQMLNSPFMGFEARTGVPGGVAPGLGLSVEPNNKFYKEIIDYYSSIHFSLEENVVTHITGLLRQRGLKEDNSFQTINDINIFPSEYFCPMNYDTRAVVITDNTYTIHHYDESWLSNRTKIINRIGRLVGPGVMAFAVSIKKRFLR